jgi:hypothetical protein
MSFSVNAAGTREQVKEQLNSSAHHHLSAEGHIIRGVLLAYMDGAASTSADGRELRYEITAYGHRSDQPGTVPSLSLSLSTTPERELPAVRTARRNGPLLAERSPRRRGLRRAARSLQ